eukprot:11434509-Alexandrium_andersonii.AAC.1
MHCAHAVAIAAYMSDRSTKHIYTPSQVVDSMPSNCAEQHMPQISDATVLRNSSTPPLACQAWDLGCQHAPDMQHLMAILNMCALCNFGSSRGQCDAVSAAKNASRANSAWLFRARSDAS